jgi:hypothetical protein
MVMLYASGFSADINQTINGMLAKLRIKK